MDVRTKEATIVASRLSTTHNGDLKKPDRAVKTEHVRYVAVILIVALIMLDLAWVGYVGTDDQSYARGALGWLYTFPYVGDTHWALRHPIVIPLALSLAV